MSSVMGLLDLKCTVCVGVCVGGCVCVHDKTSIFRVNESVIVRMKWLISFKLGITWYLFNLNHFSILYAFILLWPVSYILNLCDG